MVGTRRPDNTSPADLEPGDYCKRAGAWWVVLPSSFGPCVLDGPLQPDGWQVTEHDDRTITVSPSLHDVSKPDGWHGWLERGVWRAC